MRFVRALMLGLLVAAVGCGGTDAEDARPTTSTSEATTTTAPCGEEGVEAVTLATQDGTELSAVRVGDGEAGVVLGHQLGSDLCSWVPFAKQLAERDMRALAINFVSASPDDDMVAGAVELQRQADHLGRRLDGWNRSSRRRNGDRRCRPSRRCRHHGSSVALMPFLQSAAWSLKRSFSSDGRTRALLATPVVCT